METYQEKLQDERWKSLRSEVIKRDKYRCAHCGIHYQQLDVHHLAYADSGNPWDVPMDKLITLCHDCHVEWHKNNTPERIHIITPEEIKIEELYDKENDKYELQNLRDRRRWLIAYPVHTELIQNKKICAQCLEVKSKKNALAKYDESKFHYILIGNIPGSNVIEFLCTTELVFEDCMFEPVGSRAYNGYLWLDDDYGYETHRIIDDDNDDKRLIETICKRNNWPTLIYNNYYSSCLVQSDVELKLFYVHEELINGTFPKCLCLNV